MDLSNWKCHASSVGHLMTEPKTKADKDAGNLSETTKSFLKREYVRIKYGLKTDIETEKMEKGTKVEEDSLTLYSRFRKEMFVKNKERKENDWITGECDIFKEGIIRDIKSSWSFDTHFKKLGEPMPSIYEWQLKSYIWLYFADAAMIAHCLVDTPDFIIENEVNRLKYKITPENLEEAEEYTRRTMIFSHIPIRERVIETPMIELVTADTDLIVRKVAIARKYLIYLDNVVTNNSLLTELK